MSKKTTLLIESLLFFWTGTVMADVDEKAARSLMKKQELKIDKD